jgi:hypothetical protein
MKSKKKYKKKLDNQIYKAIVFFLSLHNFKKMTKKKSK